MLVGMITGTERIELLEMPDPIALDGHAVVAVERCGICGTDVGLSGLADAFAGLAAADRGWHKVLVDPSIG